MFLQKKVTIRISILLLSAIATGLLSGCGKSNTGTNLSSPALDTTKVSPTPTIALAPTKATTSTPVSSPRVAPSNLPELEIGELELYKHRSGILEISVPKNWQVIDRSQAGEILVTWNDQGGRATISINIFVPPSEIPENRLSDVFEVIIKGMYSDLPEFSMRSPVLEATGNVVIEWTSMVTVGNKKTKFQANSKLQRINNKFVILTFGAIEPKFTEMKDFFVKIANSQIVNASLAIP
jgi:hypothetical protein